MDCQAIVRVVRIIHHREREYQNEQSRVSEFLTPYLVKGRIISADAMHTQQKFCLTVTSSGGDYLLVAYLD